MDVELKEETKVANLLAASVNAFLPISTVPEPVFLRVNLITSSAASRVVISPESVRDIMLEFVS